MIETDQPRDGVRRLRLARPDRGNALSASLVEALIDGVQQACADASLHTLVIAGLGSDFCNGFDLGGLPEEPEVSPELDGPLAWRFARIEHLLSLVWHAPLRTVAFAQGRAFGAGADLFAACDLRLAQPGASFRFPGAAFGIVLGTRRLGEQVGRDRALDWVRTGRGIALDEALASGLAHERVDESGLPERLTPPSVDRTTFAALRRAAREDHRDRDLAALVRSATEPGLARRIAHYRRAVRARARL